MADSSSANSPFINKATALDAYTESKNWLRPYFEPLDEFERLARNKPSTKIDPSLPKITDGTIAAIVQETPKRVVQQSPTGLISSKDHPEYAKLADIALRDELIPRYNRQGNMLQKSWNMIGKSLTWGRATSYTFYTSTNGVFHTDFVIPYAKDVLTEKGKVFAADSNIRFMRSWYQKRDLQAIIEQEAKLQKKDKNYKSDWDLTCLQELIDGGASAKPADQLTPAEREKGGDNGGYEIIHAFQSGRDAEFYSFSPQMDSGKVLRVKVNQDPRGLMPFDDLYCNIDLSNPMGRGSVELSGGIQNLMDQQMQMFQFTSTLEMSPPLKVRGNVDKTRLKLRPGAIWDMGSGPNNDVEPYAISNYALQNFGNNYGLLKSSILGLNSSQDTSISSESGSPTQSKTQAGVQAQESRLGVSDNYLRKQYEDWFEDQSETSVNIYFSEMRGNQLLPLDKDDRKELEKTEAVKFINDKGQLNVPYGDIKKVAFTFSVNAGTSEIKEDADNVEKLIQTLDMASNNPNPEIQQKVPALFKMVVKEIGAEGIDEIFPDEETGPDGQPVPTQPQQPQMTPEMVQQMVMQAIDENNAQKPQVDPTLELIKALGLKFEQLPEGARQIVLEHIGMNTDEPTPADHKQAIETLGALNQADAHEREPELKQQDQQFQASQADKAAQQAQQQAANTNSQQGSTQPSTNSDNSQQQSPIDASITPDEQQLVEALLHRGFSEQDVEQAVVMMRQGMPLEQVIGTIGAKYTGGQA